MTTQHLPKRFRFYNSTQCIQLSNKCIRFPNDVINQVEKAIEGKNCTSTAFVVDAVRVALENMNEENYPE